MTLKKCDDWLTERLRAIPRNARFAAITAFVVGFVMHIAAATEMLCNWDSLISLSTDSEFLITQGKWFFPVLHSMRGLVGTGSLCVPLALCYIAISAALIVCILKIESPLFAALAGAVMVAFPSVMCTFSYAGEDIFCLAMLIAVFGVYLTQRYKFGFIAGTVLITLATGTYQSYIGFAAGLFVLVCLFDLLYDSFPRREILLRGAKFVGVLVASVVLYFITMKLVLHFAGTKLSYYRGANSMENIDFAAIPKLIYDAIVQFAVFFLKDSFGVGSTLYLVLYNGFLLLSAAIGVWIIIRSRLWRDIPRLLLTVLMVGLTPLALHCVAVLGQDPATHWIMKYPFVLAFLVPIRMADGQCDYLPKDISAKKAVLDHKVMSCAGWAVAALMLALVFNWGVLANQGYTRMQIAYEGAYANCVRMADDIYDLADGRDDMPVAFVSLETPDIIIEDEIFAYLDDFTGISNRRFLYLSGHFEYMFTHYMGAGFEYCSKEQSVAVRSDPAVQEVPVYPEKGSVIESNGVIVVRIN